ncbi:MAG: TrmH family RNA methyltransferase [Janthinobacterium lividum]
MPEEPTPTEDSAQLEGFISVLAALQGGHRTVHGVQMRIGKEDAQTRHLEQMARKSHIPIKRVSAAEIEELAGGKTHGGVLAQVGSYQFASIDSLALEKPTPFVAMIDGVEDPFNFGSSVRSLYAAGADGLVLRPRNWLSAAGIVARASAGTSELIPTAIAETAAEAADFFRSRGLTIACATDERGSVSLYDADLTIPLFLLIGGEKRGITRSFLDQADLKLRIPYGRPLPHSLGTASASAIIAFEVMRQRM